ncbi:MAG TPA: O-antigen polymerase, partial [Longimicrobium sp.]
RALPPAEAAAARRLAWWLVALALLAMVAWARVAGRTLWTFFLPGVFGATDAGGGTDVAYLFLAIEWFMPAFMVLIAAGAMRSRWRALAVLVLVSIVYVSIGFRYRLVVLWLAAAMLVYLRAGKRPALATLLPGTAVAFAVVGWVGWARIYFRSAGAVGGLTTDRRRILLGALSDTRIFETFTAVLGLVPNYVRFAHFRPLLYIFILPFPRFLWHGKPMPTWLDDVRTSIGTPYSEFAGAAVPHFGEYYIAFGWPGMVIGSLLFGMAVKLLWRWYRADPGDPWRQAIFALNTAFLFVAIIRGYAAQIVQEWCFIVLPAIVLVWLARRSGRLYAAAQAHA